MYIGYREHPELSLYGKFTHSMRYLGNWLTEDTKLVIKTTKLKISNGLAKLKLALSALMGTYQNAVIAAFRKSHILYHFGALLLTKRVNLKHLVELQSKSVKKALGLRQTIPIEVGLLVYPQSDEIDWMTHCLTKCMARNTRHPHAKEEYK